MLEFEIYCTCNHFRKIQSAKDITKNGWCLPACVTTLIYHWNIVMKKILPVPVPPDMQFWVDLWLPFMKKTQESGMGGINTPFYSDIPNVLEELKIDQNIRFEEIPNVYGLLDEAKRLLNYDLPIPVIVNVLAKKYYNNEGYSGMHHAIILMGLDRANNFRIFDPFQPEFEQKWTVKNKDLLVKCLSMESHLSYLIPKDIKSISTVSYKQVRLVV